MDIKISLTLPVARDLAYYGIRMVTIAPGVFDTPILGGLSAELKQGLASDIPYKFLDPLIWVLFVWKKARLFRSIMTKLPNFK